MRLIIVLKNSKKYKIFSIDGKALTRNLKSDFQEKDEKFKVEHI
jgi:hypothetical protein